MNGRISSPLDPHALIPAAELQGISAYETQLLLSYLERARACLESFAWCTEVRDQRFGVGMGGVIAVFLMEALVKGRTREWLWVVTGDLPAAYFASSRAATPCEALAVYCELIERWIDAVNHGTLHRDVFALGVEATPEVAAELAAKLQTIKRSIVPALCRPRPEGPSPDP